MRFPPEPEPFTERITVVGTLSNGTQTTARLDCLIDISQTGSHGITGWILGNKATADQIEQVDGADGALHLRASTGSETIASDSVWIRQTSSYGAGQDMPDGLLGVVCKFDCLELARRFDFKSEPKSSRSREVRFLLRGPRKSWPIAWQHGRSYTGESKVTVLNPRLATGELPFAMLLVPHFFHAREAARGRSEDRKPDARETNVLALVCRTHKAIEAYDDASFLNDARRAAEDMCLLASLLAGTMIVWHTYIQSGAGYVSWHIRSLSRPLEWEQERDEEIVFRSHVRDFLRIGFRRMRRLREEGVDLELPIVYAISGARERVARQRFGELFLALEALHSIHLKHKSKTFLIERSIFKRVKDRLEVLLRTALLDEGIRSRKLREQFLEKLGGINRPSLWQGVQTLMKRLRVDWEDLYPAPAPAKPTFLRLRNSLFHSHTSADDENVVKEAIRLEAVVHRIILRWLGWEDLWHAPSPWIRHFVSGKSLPDRHRLTGRPRRKKHR